MKKIIFSLFVLLLFKGISVFSDFSDFTSITSSENFQKPSGLSELRVYEDYLINPFEGKKIIKNTVQCNGNNCPCGVSGCSYTSGYSVDGRFFNSSHPLYFGSGTIRQDWYQHSDGIIARTEYRDNTFTRDADGILMPNQSVKVRKYYIVQYKHDTTKPTCGEVKYYDDENLTQDYTHNGGWLNKPKYYTMVCEDPQTECYCAPDDSNCIVKNGKVISTPQLLGHMIRPRVSFTNKVLLSENKCEPGGSYQSVLFDLKNPRADLIIAGVDTKLNLKNNRDYKIISGKKADGEEILGRLEYTLSGGINMLAGNSQIDLQLSDLYLTGSVYGVSGIRAYSFRVIRNTNQSHQVLPPDEISSCSKDGTFPAYNIDGTLEVSDIKNLNFDCPELLKSGKYTLKITASDWGGSITRITIPLNIYPNAISIANSSLSVDSVGGKYANNSDTYMYTLTLQDAYGNPIYGRNFDSISQSINGYSGGKTISLGGGGDALITEYIDSKTQNDGTMRFSLKSIKPGSFTQRFRLKFKDWDQSYIQNGADKSEFLLVSPENNFLSPFTADISIIDPVGGKPEVGSLQKYEINLKNPGNLTSISNGRLNISKLSLNFRTGHRFDTVLPKDTFFSPNSDMKCSFDGSINVTDQSSVLKAPEIINDRMPISYTIGGKNVRYYLPAFGMLGCDIGTLGLKVKGNIQGDGKSNITGIGDNISDLSTTSFRTIIRKNAYDLISGQLPGTTLNGVHYVEGDITISGNLNYETLIVKNGNVFISGNLNTSQNKLGIIVLKDSPYILESDYNKSGNIYISNAVKNLYGAFYADGAILSAKATGAPYSDSELRERLYLKGALFTKNTIGGGVEAGGSLLLPGGGSTSNLSLAKRYDLNYTRKTPICGDDDYSFLIEYDSRLQGNPPKGFTTQ